MTKSWKNLLILAAVILAPICMFIQYENSSQPAQNVSAPVIAQDSAPQIKTVPVDPRYSACLKAADTSHEVSWEINCENTVEGAAQRYNECVTTAALEKNLTSAPKSCESNCLLPKGIARGLDRARDEAKASCLKNMQTAVSN